MRAETTPKLLDVAQVATDAGVDLGARTEPQTPERWAIPSVAKPDGYCNPTEYDPACHSLAHLQCVRGCGRSANFGEPFCFVCRELEEYMIGPNVVKRCESIGVHSKFIRDGQPPTLDDDGLRQRIARKPLPPGGLLIVGPIGTHKTHLVCARAVNAAYRGYSARVVKWPTLLREIRATFRPGSRETEADVLGCYMGIGYLAIDEIGLGRDGEQVTEFALGVAYAIIDHRYERQLVTDFTGNITMDDLAERFDDRIVRRIREMASVYSMLKGA